MSKSYQKHVRNFPENGIGLSRGRLPHPAMTGFFVRSSCVLGLLTLACGHAHATGDYLAPTMLSDGGKQVIGTPEFFWELECKRIAMEFVPAEKRVVSPAPVKAKADDDAQPQADDAPAPSDSREAFTTAMDVADFKAALRDGALKPADPVKAAAAHAAAREVVKTASLTRADGQLPEETPGEFADYHKGALAFKTRHYPRANAAWKAILAKPAAERKYRSTWTAYMLGRCALDERKFAAAVGFFQQTRQLAKDGFADSLGLAQESYGWEARCELERGHSEAAAKLYLTQLAAGDPSAVVSLKWFIPDWGLTVKGKGSENAKPGVNAEPDAGAGADADTGPAASVPRGAKALAAAAHSPLLRRLVTAHILATAGWMDNEYVSPVDRSAPQAKWLAALDQAGVKDTPDAEYIAWIAYSAGKYNDANRWLAKSSGTSAAALWLQAKLALRDGKIPAGTKLLSQALRVFPLPHAELENSQLDRNYRAPSATASGELAILHLAQADFIQALDAFITAGLWYDAAYIAERCLTKAELLEYARSRKVADLKPKTAADDDTLYAISPERFRDLVARRMVRENDYQTAKEFFTPEKIKVLDGYTAALSKGTDAATPKPEQARALFHAAWIARYQGMELMGTEIGPDNTATDGAFNEGDLAIARLTGKEPEIEDTQRDSGDENFGKPIQFALPVTPQEKDRLQTTKLVIERRFHYRHVAADIAWKAAALMPDNSAETTDVLNTAGNWLKARHEKQAERFFLAIKNRCPNTDTGKQAVAKHWFIDADGPWSAEERKLMPPPEPR